MANHTFEKIRNVALQPTNPAHWRKLVYLLGVAYAADKAGGGFYDVLTRKSLGGPWVDTLMQAKAWSADVISGRRPMPNAADMKDPSKWPPWLLTTSTLLVPMGREIREAYRNKSKLRPLKKVQQ